MITTELIQGFLLGLIGGLIPGPLMTLVFVQTLQFGKIGGLRVILYGLLGELIVAGALLGFSVYFDIPEIVFIILGFAGAFFLCYMAWGVAHIQNIDKGEGSQKPKQMTPWWQISVLMAVNAPLYIFWTTVCFPFIWKMADAIMLWKAAMLYFIAFELGWLIATTAVFIVFLKARQFLEDQKTLHRIFLALSMILIFFSIKMFWDSVSYFL